MTPLLYILEKMPVPRTGLHGSLYVTVMAEMFTKCLGSGQYAINTLERINRNNRVTHVMQYSLHVQNVESGVNLDPWGMDTCVGCRISAFYCRRPRANTWVHALYYNNINRPYDDTYSQPIYVPKYSPRCAWFLRLFYAANI